MEERERERESGNDDSALGKKGIFIGVHISSRCCITNPINSVLGTGHSIHKAWVFCSGADASPKSPAASDLASAWSATRREPNHEFPGPEIPALWHKG
jgi:hypothetical protein